VSLPVTTTPEVDAQIRTIDDWWRENRSASPDLFLDELSGAFDVLARAPLIGRLYRRSPVAGTRRVLLRATRYHVYYVPDDDEVRIIAVWHGSRVSDRRCGSRRLGVFQSGIGSQFEHFSEQECLSSIRRADVRFLTSSIVFQAICGRAAVFTAHDIEFLEEIDHDFIAHDQPLFLNHSRLS
jgi:plasmid stabilization system protein ParE